MKTYLVLFLCLSVLLSGCITANTAIFEPEPDSGEDWAVRVLGGWGDFALGYGLGMGITHIVMLIDNTGPSWPSYEYIYLADFLILAGSIGTILTDVVIRNALPYRKAYYQDKETEEKTTEEEKPSDVTE